MNKPEMIICDYEDNVIRNDKRFMAALDKINKHC